MTYLRAGLFKSSQKHFEKAYCFFSKRSRTVTKEFITRESKRNLTVEPLKSGKETRRTRDPSSVMAVENFDAYMVKAGRLTTLAAIANLFQRGKLFIDLKKTVDSKNGFEFKLVEQLQNDGVQTLSKLLKEYFEVDSTSFEKTLKKKQHAQCPAIISAHKVPSL